MGPSKLQFRARFGFLFFTLVPFAVWLVFVAGSIAQEEELTEPTIELAFSTYLATDIGTTPSYATLRDIAVDSAGNYVVVGSGDYSPVGYPGVPVFTYGVIDSSSIIVAKLSPDGSQLHWVALLGGTGIDKGGYGVAIDSADNIYVAGETGTTDFPTTANAFDRDAPYATHLAPEAYAFKLAANGQSLIYSTYLSGSNGDFARGGLTIDGQGHAYVVGATKSPDFLENASSGNPANKLNGYIGGVGDGVVVKLSPDGSEIVFARHFGSPSETNYEDVITGIVLDDQQNINMVAFVRGPDATTTDGSNYNGGSSDLFLIELSADGSQLLYSAYYGGSGEDGPEHGFVKDSAGNLYIAGFTDSSDFPVLNPDQAAHGGGYDGFLIKFSPNWQPLFATYVGSTGDDVATGVDVTATDHIIVVGGTESANFPVTATAMDSTLSGISDGFVRQYSLTGQMLYSSFLGGSGSEMARFIEIDLDGHPLILGDTQSIDFPTTIGAYDTTWNNNWDVSVTKLSVASDPDLSPGLFLPLIVNLQADPVQSVDRHQSCSMFK